MLLKFEAIENKDILVEQTGGEAGTTKRQKDTLRGLKLRGIGSKAEFRCTRDIYGMLVKVSHLIKVNLK